MKKKLQIFVSSTYLDLEEERQSAVESILSSKHIPAGMELFRAGNKSQWETIKRWIDESDIYMLILGGRYGSIEPESGKSYTQLEYEYALEKEMPLFAVILTNQFLYHKVATQKNDDIIKDLDNPKFKEFKELVMSKMIKEVEDCKDIKLAIKDSIAELEEECNLIGWVKGTEIEDNSDILKENIKINKENLELIRKNTKLEAELSKLKNQIKSKENEYETIKNELAKKEITFCLKDKEEKINLLNGFKRFSGYYSLGINNKKGMSDSNKILYFTFAPEYIKLGLLDIKKVAGTNGVKEIELSKLGKEFLTYLAKEEIEESN
ncbi:DUF4062 domain-containing protein [Clostridium perfringens]|uniref:DUF4062 domain-containing protein n=1 Tax=Clostridium perfringens TaxID=1502 RepID=UPI002245B846|nr:DUF4062 domain-containing protein [Clostridium perfringens]MCX0398431.1 DUF4062 domain-containing protein [Clostridium perfringens]